MIENVTQRLQKALLDKIASRLVLDKPVIQKLLHTPPEDRNNLMITQLS